MTSIVNTLPIRMLFSNLRVRNRVRVRVCFIQNVTTSSTLHPRKIKSESLRYILGGRGFIDSLSNKKNIGWWRP